ncbi:Prolyl carboxy peptidase like protein 5 [Diplonema papillatum]|nr:Prolyl carboxy peptidase like protein 5 [Diplonema papillatum]
MRAPFSAIASLAACVCVVQGYPKADVTYVTQPVDHFDFRVPARTFEQRVLVNADAWTGEGKLPNGCRGPILFYTGNEGPIPAFWASAGFVVEELAQELHALVLFAEHRYYGESLPFGNQSLSTPENARYLSVEQALADYAQVITNEKSTRAGAAGCPVISFGGSYGATLTTFFRLKYPHIVAGGLAASCPLGYYDPAAWASNGVTGTTWIDIVNKNYRDAGCLDTVVQVRDTVNATAQTAAGRQQLKALFKLCYDVDTADQAVFLLTDAIETFPQLDYPDAVAPAPEWPVNATCALLNATNAGDPAAALRAAATIVSWFITPDPGRTCSSVKGLGGIPGGGPPTLGGDVADSWAFQSCTETLHEFDGRGVRDFAFSLDQVNRVCNQSYSVRPKPNWLALQYGGYAINTSASDITNIIWSNGAHDPWHGGSFLSTDRPTCHTLWMPNGAHHVDLRSSSPNDTPDITETRAKEKAIIAQWIQEASQP